MKEKKSSKTIDIVSYALKVSVNGVVLLGQKNAFACALN